MLAALAADAPSVVRRVYHLDRGYERLEDKLRALGADVTGVDDAPQNVPPELNDCRIASIESDIPAPATVVPAPHFEATTVRTETAQR